MGIRIADEIDLKLGAMWKNLPGKICGIFGEAAGYSCERVTAFVSELLHEVEMVPDKKTLPAVAMRYFEGPIHEALKLKVRLNWPLRQFRDLYMKARGHATMLVTNRRNEGDHRNIALELRAMSNVTAQLIAARLRKDQARELSGQSAFLIFAERMWNKRGPGSITNQLLEHRVESWRLLDFSFAMKARHIYGTTASAQHADSSATAKAIALHSSTMCRAPRSIGCSACQISRCQISSSGQTPCWIAGSDAVLDCWIRRYHLPDCWIRRRAGSPARLLDHAPCWITCQIAGRTRKLLQHKGQFSHLLKMRSSSFSLGPCAKGRYFHCRRHASPMFLNQAQRWSPQMLRQRSLPMTLA